MSNSSPATARTHRFRLHDTLTGELVALPQRVPGACSIYACGPTVYGPIHVGNARPAVVFDTLVRHLRASGVDVTYVRNFTDIDDKIIKVANTTGETPMEVAERNIAAYHRDTESVGCQRPNREPRVSEHLPEIIAMVQTLIEKGHAYEVDGDVYYRVKSFEGYGKLSKRDFTQASEDEHQRKNDASMKEDPHDFALWKSSKEDEGPGARWCSPWGDGRPGWHIECSAMARKWLGETFDVHGGGIDLIFPHHENEIAQSEACTGHPFASAWMHNGFININNKKASKSDADTYTAEVKHYFVLKHLCERVEPEAVRLWILGTHYRSPLSFEFVVDEALPCKSNELRPTTFPALEEAEGRLEYFYATRARMFARAHFAEGAPAARPDHIVSVIVRSFHEAMDEDLNTAAALGHLSELYKRANELCDANRKEPIETRALLEALDHTSHVLGIGQENPAAFAARVRTRRALARGIDPAAIDALLTERIEARKRKDFARSDAIRDELIAKKIELRDDPAGTVWRILA
ncbi:MAG: cysteine--tRNA ligase [Deltaproteobacteria bacterium]|nr:cysteine--tRNA ligase [Deltaproteobacteria bacterium]